MATNTEQASAGTHAAVNGIASLSDSLRMAQDLKAAISSFTSANGFQILSQLSDLIPELEKNIREKDDRIQELAGQLFAEKESYSANEQKQLKIYSRAYDTWKDREAALQISITELQEILQERDTGIRTLQQDLSEFKAKGRELETKFKAKIASLKEKEQETTQLRQQLQQTQANVDGFSEKLSKSQSRLTKLEALSDKNRIEHEKLKEESVTTKDRLKELLKFSAPLKGVNLKDMTNELEGLWISATGLVRRSFGQDLQDEMLQNNWDKVRDIAIFKHQIPMPRSNSEIAKEMRIATVLGILARLIDKYIFQPTYILSEESGFRELLCGQATIDQRKERFVRGTLLSMFPEKQESNGKERIGWVVDDLFEIADITAFLAYEAIVPFGDELENFLSQVQDTWRSIQHSKQKLEPTFIYTPDTNLPWHNFELQLTVDDESEHPVSPVATDGLEGDLFVIFPRFYLMGSETRSITTGTILQKAQVRVAAQEVRKAASHTPFEQQTLSHQRSRTSRRMSISGDGARSGPTKKRFLSKLVTSTYI